MDQRATRIATVVRYREAGDLDAALSEVEALAKDHPNDGEIAFHSAWVHDKIGLEADAVVRYEQALASGQLTADQRQRVMLGLGSSYRTLGRYTDAVAMLQRGVDEHPNHGALQVFLAMASYNHGDPHTGMRILLKLLAETSGDEQIQNYRRAILHYAQDLDAT